MRTRCIGSSVVSVLVLAFALVLLPTPGMTGTAQADPLGSLVAAGNAEAAARGTTVGIAVLDRRTGRYVDNGANARLRFGSASIVKLFVADSVLRRASRGEVSLSRADRDRMSVMLRSSDDAAASSLWSRFGGSGIVSDVVARYGLTETAPPANPRYWGLTQISAHDVARFYAGLMSGAGGLGAADRDWLVGELRQATARGTDGVYQWFGLHDALPREQVLGIKQGWMCCIGDGALWRHSTGLVGPDARYVVVVLARDPASAGAAHTEATTTRVVRAMFPAGLVPRVQGAVGDHWYGTGGQAGPVGLPIAEELPATRGRWQPFERGRIYWSSATGAHWLRGSILRNWLGQGSENGQLGYPTSDEGLLPGGAWQLFQGGRVYWSPSTGAHWVRGTILRSWEAQGSENGTLGYPTSDGGTLSGGAWQLFQGGRVYWSPASGAHWLRGSILRTWVAQGSENGQLGYPTSDEGTLRGGAWQVFQGGRAYWSPATGAHWLSGPVLRAWTAQGSENGPLGYPVSDPRQVTGGTRVDFQGGSLTARPDGTVVDSRTRTTAAATPAPTTPAPRTTAPSTTPPRTTAPTTTPPRTTAPTTTPAPATARTTGPATGPTSAPTTTRAGVPAGTP